MVRWDNENYRTAGKFIGRGPSVRCSFPWLGGCKSNYHTITTIWRPRVCLTSYILNQDSHFKQNNFGLCILRCIISRSVEKETCHKLYKANDFRWYMWPASMYIPGWMHWQIYQESILMQLNKVKALNMVTVIWIFDIKSTVPII